LYNKRRRFIKLALIIGGLLSLLTLGAWGFQFTFFSSTYHAKHAVKEFYDLEQKGNFSDSWEYFHPAMKVRFEKGAYIQDRAHVFLNHFGVETFSYDITEIEKLDTWKMTDDGEEWTDVYQMKVIQVYKGKYGNFSINQSVFAVKTEGEWTIAWDYNQ